MANYNIFKKGGLIVVIDANGNYFSEPANRVNIFKSTSSATAFSVFFTRYDPIINIPFANIVDENNSAYSSQAYFEKYIQDNLTTSSAEDRITANKGTFLVNNTTEKTANFYGVFVLEDTVISSLKVSGTDVKSNYISDATKAIKAGTLITGTGVLFSGITLTSGSVNLLF